MDTLETAIDAVVKTTEAPTIPASPLCLSCDGTGRGPLEGVKETTCSTCEGTGLTK
jgi:DnaJ-class molecular chaperone